MLRLATLLTFGLALFAGAPAQAQTSVACTPFRGFPMAVNLGVAPLGIGGETTRCVNQKVQAAINSLASRSAGNAAIVASFIQDGDPPGNVAPAVARAIAAGNRVLQLPANSTYTPPNNQTPADVELLGDPSRTSVISVANRSTDLLAIGPRSSLRNVGIISSFCDGQTQPQGVSKVCYAGQVDNVSDTTFAAQNWVGTRLFVNSGPTYTGPSGVVSHDLPSIQIIANGQGTDAIYAQSNAPEASAARLVTSANGAVGAQIFNGQGCPSCSGTRGILINEFGDGTGGQQSLAISRIGDGTSIHVDDYAAQDDGHQKPSLEIGLSKQGGGNVIDLFHGGTGFAGNFMHINAGFNGAGWTGNYLRFDRGGLAVFQVDANGGLYSAQSVTALGYGAGGKVGVSCNGTPTSQFEVTNGIVTRC